jgi:3-hydroxyacyl-CoA dehydrogenase
MGVDRAFMSNTLDGGGSFQHFMDRLGSALQSWDGDMQENAFNFSPEKVDFLNGSVQEWVDTADLDGIAQERDESLLEFITAKSNQFSNGEFVCR